MRADIVSHAMIIATCFHFIICDHHHYHKVEKHDDDGQSSWKTTTGRNYCNSLIFGHSGKSDFTQWDSNAFDSAGSESVYFCHPTSSTEYVRCSLSVSGTDEAGHPRKFVVREDEYSCGNDTHFSSSMKACVPKRFSNCADRFNSSSWTSVTAHEQSLCNNYLRRLPKDVDVTRSRLICHDQSPGDFVVCPLNSAFALRYSCANGLFFNQNLSKCVFTAELSDCPITRHKEDVAQSASMVQDSSLRECICNCLLDENPDRTVLYAGNPDDDHTFLICFRDGRIYTNKCPGDNSWNYRVRGCAKNPMRKSFPQCGSSGSSGVDSGVVNAGGHNGGTTNQQRCICQVALLNADSDEIVHRCDPHDPSRFLACARGSVTVHACPRGLFWNGKRNRCASAKACVSTPPHCGLKSTLHIPQSVAPIQRCICAEALIRSGRGDIHRCDPLNENGYMVCHFGRVERKSCPPGQKWNVLKSSCCTTHKCLPVPSRCRFGAHVTTSPPPTTTTTTMPTCVTKYTLYHTKLTWHFARLVCEANLSELAVILNNETQAMLTQKYGVSKKKSYGGIWIGASDGGEEGKWRWVTGPLVEYSNWYPDQPSGYKYQHCMQFNYYYKKGAWDDTRCYYKKKFLCQKEECSSTPIRLP